MANIGDVAKKANVSKATVSRYINNKQVSESTALRIKQAIEELAFVPNRFAQSISSSKSNLIGIIVPNLRNPFYMEIVSNIEKMATQDKFNCLIFSSHNDVAYENEALKVCEQFKVHGVVLASCDNNNDVSSFKVPIVAVDCFLETAKVNIIVNNFRIGQIVSEHFTKAKCKNILYLEQDHTNDTVLTRQDSFKKSIADDVTVTYMNVNDDDVSSTRDKLLLLEDLTSYDGVFLSNEIIALAYYNIVEQPAFCVTVDGTHTNISMFKRLVTVAQPIDRMSDYAYRSLKHFAANQRTYKLEVEEY